jgi:hypothetical protein
MIDQIVLQLTPWQAQIMMLPLRRPDPDAKRKTSGQAARAEGCRRSGLQKQAQTEAKIRAIVRKMPGITASEVAVQLGFSRNYTYKMVNGMIDEGILLRDDGKTCAQPLYLMKVTPCR